jgi:RimJ/RimL family protein N-acetyltransferase
MNSPATLAARLGTTTPRLALQPLVAADAARLAALTDDPAITGAISFLRSPFTAEDAARLIATNDSQGECFLAVRRGGELVGVIGAHCHGAEDIEIGYWIGTDHQGRGYASEATAALVARIAAVLPERTIVAECRQDNRASWRVLEKAGFCRTGEPGARPGRTRLIHRG